MITKLAMRRCPFELIFIGVIVNDGACLQNEVP